MNTSSEPTRGACPVLVHRGRHFPRVSEVDSRCEPVADLGEAEREVLRWERRDHVPFERLVVRDRGLAVGRPEQDRESELCGSRAAVSPAEAVR